jgi:hypothetical protein
MGVLVGLIRWDDKHKGRLRSADKFIEESGETAFKR